MGVCVFVAETITAAQLNRRGHAKQRDKGLTLSSNLPPNTK